MGTFNESQQAFLHVTREVESDTAGPGLGLRELGIHGILGLSFDFAPASPINRAVTEQSGPNATWGSSVLRNIFSQDGRNGSNFIALDLSRADDSEDVDGGSFYIGEYAEQWAAVAQAPKLYQYPRGGYRWATLLEGIAVGGTPLDISSLVRGAPDERLVALLDTGVPYTDIPSSVRNDLYSRIPGAVTFIWPQGPPGQVWVLPCNTTTVVEFTFGGQRFPIHPLDLSYLSGPIMAGGHNYTACFANFDATDDGWPSAGLDALLGDAFLRNVYSVFDFGDANGTAAGQPYMQLLAQTDPAEAIAQVTLIRNRIMANLPPEIEPAKLLEMLQAEDPSIRTETSTRAGNPLSTASLLAHEFSSEVQSSVDSSAEAFCNTRNYGANGCCCCGKNSQAGCCGSCFGEPDDPFAEDADSQKKEENTAKNASGDVNAKQPPPTPELRVPSSSATS
ncbi:hypothetical protein MD484_g5829, partial [Candolleomyces efflorescens]